MNHIMLDTETLGTRADSVIISIGAVKFDPYSNMPFAIEPETFYASVSIDSNHEAGPRDIDEDTLVWWLDQSASARRVFTEPKTTLRCALEDLAFYINHPDYEMWSNGADFDLPLLTHAYRSFGLEVPWQHSNTNCFRTMKKLPFARALPAVPQADKHHARADAAHQARVLQQYFAALGALHAAPSVGTAP